MQNSPRGKHFVEALAPALRQAASIARALEGRVPNRPKASEASAVKAALTVADTACQEALLAALVTHLPEVRLEAEEDTPLVHRFPERSDAVVVIDPIDGTLRFYLESLGPYAIMAGLAIDDAYVGALVALPRQELCFDAAHGDGARRAEGEAVPSSVRAEGEAVPSSVRAAPAGNRVYISHDLPEAAQRELRSRGFEVAPACGGAISVAPLVPGVRGGLRWVAEGATGVSIRGRIGALISAEAGASVRGEDGRPFTTDLYVRERALVVAADDETLDALQAAVALAARD